MRAIRIEHNPAWHPSHRTGGVSEKYLFIDVATGESLKGVAGYVIGSDDPENPWLATYMEIHFADEKTEKVKPINALKETEPAYMRAPNA